MSFLEDKEDFNSTGLRGLVQKLMKKKDEFFVVELEGGWRGEEVESRPEPGAGPYIHFRHGNGALRYSNSTPQDTAVEIYRTHI
jgi:hypothetical protein